MARGDWHKSYLILCQNLFISSFKFKLFFTGRRNTVLGINKFFKEMKRDLWIGRVSLTTHEWMHLLSLVALSGTTVDWNNYNLAKRAFNQIN